MKIKAGDELFVNDKWYWDVVSIEKSTIVLQMPYTEGDDTFLNKNISLPINILKLISGNDGIYNVNANESELKKVLGPFMTKLVLQPDVYSIIGVTHIKESFDNLDDDESYEEIDFSKLSESQAKLLNRIKNIKYNSIDFEEWEEYAESLGITTYALIEYIMRFQNTDDDLTESAFFLESEASYLGIYTSFTRFVEEGVAMATASMGGDCGVPSVPESPSEPGVPGEPGRDIVSGGWTGVYMKKAAGVATKQKKAKKKKISNAEGDVGYGLAKLITKASS